MKQTEFNLPRVNPPGIVPVGATLLREENWDVCFSRFYLLSQKETEKMVTKQTLEIRWMPPNKYCPKGYVVHKGTERHQKFLCVNGPCDGQMMTEEQGALKGYSRYNCAGMARRSGKVIPRNVLVSI